MTFVSWTSKQHLQPSSIVAKFSPFGEKKFTAKKPSGDSAGQGFLGKKAGGVKYSHHFGEINFFTGPDFVGDDRCIPRWRFKTKWHSCWWKESQTTTGWVYTKIVKIIEKHRKTTNLNWWSPDFWTINSGSFSICETQKSKVHPVTKGLGFLMRKISAENGCL